MTPSLPLLRALLAAALLLASCTAVGGGGGAYRVTAWFPSAVSLYRSSTVRVLGLPAGRVTGLSTEGGLVRVTMAIDRDIALPRGVNATIVPQSLIGERYVQLFPAWTEGSARAGAGTVIPLERTSVPVEPDEALAALKRLLDALDPHATGRLVSNLAADLRGNGQRLNEAVKGLSGVGATLAGKDQQLAGIITHLDALTATLRTRETTLATVLDQFAVAARLAADERGDIAALVRALGTVSSQGLDLVSEHGARLDHDLTVLTHTLQGVNANIDSVRQLLTAAPTLALGSDLTGRNGGLAAAFDPRYQHIDLRDQVSPTLTQLIAALGLGGPACIPVDVNCAPDGQAAVTGGDAQGRQRGAPGAPSAGGGAPGPGGMPGAAPASPPATLLPPLPALPGVTVPLLRGAATGAAPPPGGKGPAARLRAGARAVLEALT